jgi:hypothetical protein
MREKDNLAVRVESLSINSKFSKEILSRYVSLGYAQAITYPVAPVFIDVKTSNGSEPHPIYHWFNLETFYNSNSGYFFQYSLLNKVIDRDLYLQGRGKISNSLGIGVSPRISIHDFYVISGIHAGLYVASCCMEDIFGKLDESSMVGEAILKFLEFRRDNLWY